MWEIARDIAVGNSYGDIGVSPNDKAQLKLETEVSDPYVLIAFLELYWKTKNQVFLKMAQRVGDNIIADRFHKGFFVPSTKHIYNRFDSIEPLVLMHLYASVNNQQLLVK